MSVVVHSVVRSLAIAPSNRRQLVTFTRHFCGGKHPCPIPFSTFGLGFLVLPILAKQVW
jgi:hypothetical protein